MRILVSIGHPAHVHFFKNFIWEMQKRGHTLGIVTKDREMAVKLLDIYSFDYYKISNPVIKDPLNPISFKNFIKFIYQNLKVAKDFRPDICTGIGTVGLTYASKFQGVKSLVFTDSERADLQNLISFPFADRIYTPECYQGDIGSKQIRYPGYHELAYLHPNRFSPNRNILNQLDLDSEEKIFVLRFVGWKAVHDVGKTGLSIEVKRELVSNLSENGRVFITSESPLPEEFEKYRVSIPPHRIHDLLYYANIYVGDSKTMATEASLLGTPTIRYDPIEGERGNFEELENKYNLMFNTSNESRVIEILTTLLAKKNLQEKWLKRRNSLLEDKVDVTRMMVNIIENFDGEKGGIL